jgi:hypothetical protein
MRLFFTESPWSWTERNLSGVIAAHPRKPAVEAPTAELERPRGTGRARAGCTWPMRTERPLERPRCSDPWTETRRPRWTTRWSRRCWRTR